MGTAMDGTPVPTRATTRRGACEKQPLSGSELASSALEAEARKNLWPLPVAARRRRLAFLAAWIVGFGLLLDVNPAESEEMCRSVELTGEAEAVALVARYLSVRGVALADAGCDSTLAQLRRRDERIEVTITTPAGQTETRLVSDEATAATFIESWAQAEAFDPLALPQEPAEPEVSAVAPDPTAAAATPPGPLAFGAQLGSEWGADGSFWGAVALSTSWSFEAFSLGVGLHGAIDSALSGDSDRLANNRYGLDGLVYGELPLRLGPGELRPAVGVGVAWLHTSAPAISNGDPFGNGEEEDEDTAQRGRDAASNDSVGFLLDLLLGYGLPLGYGLELDFGLGLGLYPLADTTLDEARGLAAVPGWRAKLCAGVEYRLP